MTEPIFPLRRGTVSKECIHIALGITPEGQKAVLGYEIAPNENNALLVHPVRQASKTKESKQVSLCSDRWLPRGLKRLSIRAYPLAKQQRCLIHISRNLASKGNEQIERLFWSNLKRFIVLKV